MSFDIDSSDLSLDFDPTEVEVETSYEPIPDGVYPVNLTKVEMKPTRAGNGKRLVVSCKITDGDHRGRSLFTGLNVANPNPVAQEIGRKQLRQLLQAVNLDGCRDMGQLVGKECLASIIIKPAQNGYPAGNDIKSFKASGTATALAPTGKKPSWV
jgi:hypothetical protein